MEKIKILLSDDHQLFLEALEMMINLEDDLEVLGKTQNGVELMDYLNNDKRVEPDIIILDINMPDVDGIEALKLLSKTSFSGHVIMLSSMTDTRMVHESMKKGAHGFLSKRCARKEIIQAIRTVQSGEPYFGETINKEILHSIFPGKKTSVNNNQYLISQLTQRELDVLKLIALEYTSKEIAEQLFIAQSTVDTHRKKLIEKLKVKNSVGLGKIALANNLI